MASVACPDTALVTTSFTSAARARSWNVRLIARGVIFRPGPLEATSAAVGSIVLVVAHDLGHATAGIVLGIAATTGSRVIALWLGIRAPRIPYTESQNQQAH